MTKTQPNGLLKIIKDHIVPISVAVVGWIVTLALLSARVTALEAVVAEYPSQDWFELKFENIDMRLESLETKLK